MSDFEILQTLSRILRELVSNDSIELALETQRSDVDGWDSFNYINFIVAAEQEFGVKFALADIESFHDVGAIVKQIQRMKPR